MILLRGEKLKSKGAPEMISSDNHKLWLAHPTGKIAKGEFCSTCARFNARTLATNAILLDESNIKSPKILLVKRGENPDKGWWDIPGGYLDWDETLEECTTRELKEETGLIAQPESFSLFNTFSNPNNKAQNQVVDLYYISKRFSGEIKIDGKEITDAQWFELSHLPENVAFNHRTALDKLKESLG